MKQIAKVDLMGMAGGAVLEKINIAANEILENIADPNTDPKKERTLTITFKFKADETREVVSVTALPVAKLAPYKPVAGSMWMQMTEGGLIAKEIGKGVIPNQVTLEEEAKARAKEEGGGNVVPLKEARRV